MVGMLFRISFIFLFILFHCMTIKNLREYNRQEKNRCQHLKRESEALKSRIEYLEEILKIHNIF